jgi:ribonuclease HI
MHVLFLLVINMNFCHKYGDICWSGAGRIAHAQDALQTEAEACIQAMTLAQQIGMTKIIIETDAQLLVQAVRSNEADIAPNGGTFPGD